MTNRIKELRKKNNYSLEDISIQTGIPKSSLSEYEKGPRQPRKQEIWQKLATLFNVDIAYLMGLSDIPNAKKTTPNNIKKYRLDRQITLQELSELTSISEKMLDDFENGKKPILHSSTWLSIADALKVPVSYLTDQEKENLKAEINKKTKQLDYFKRKEYVLENLINLDSHYFSEFSDLFLDLIAILKLDLKESDPEYIALKNILDDSFKQVRLSAKIKEKNLKEENRK